MPSQTVIPFWVSTAWASTRTGRKATPNRYPPPNQIGVLVKSSKPTLPRMIAGFQAVAKPMTTDSQVMSPTIPAASHCQRTLP